MLLLLIVIFVSKSKCCKRYQTSSSGGWKNIDDDMITVEIVIFVLQTYVVILLVLLLLLLLWLLWLFCQLKMCLLNSFLKRKHLYFVIFKYIYMNKKSLNTCTVNKTAIINQTLSIIKPYVHNDYFDNMVKPFVTKMV